MQSLTPSSNIRIIERAEIPSNPAGPANLALIMGALVGLGLGIGLAFLLEFLDDSVKSIEDLEDLVKLPSLGVIPLANGQSERVGWRGKRGPPRGPINLMTSQNGNPMFTEAYRTLRTSVLLSSASRVPRTIVISSNEAGAGKTTTAVNIALALAQAGKRVLLIDGDMRHPGCHAVFGLENGSGLSTALASGEGATAIYHDCEVLGLDILTSGPIPPNPSELLSSEALRLLLQTMTGQYDQVIVDTPPLGLVSDALILSSIVDGVILVVKAEGSSRRGVQRAKDALRSVNAKILGVALNAVDMRRHQYGYYGYGYGYGSGYGYYYYQGGKQADQTEPRVDH